MEDVERIGLYFLNSSRRKGTEMESWPVQNQHREIALLLGLVINLHHSLPYGILNINKNKITLYLKCLVF